MKETQIEKSLIGKLTDDLKYIYRPDIRDRQTLEANFRQKFDALNRVNLTDAEFARLREDIVTGDVFTASKNLRTVNTFRRADDTPLQYTLVNINDWCKNEFEVIHQLRMNTADSHHRYDVILLINGLPVVQIELKTLDISPRRAMQQIVDYKNDVGNGYGNSLLCFMQLFIVSNQSDTYYFTNNLNQHFGFNADEQYLPVYKFADQNNRKIDHLDDFADKFLGRCALAEMISRYMVLVASEQKLLIMRPYQIYAVKEIVNCIRENRGNGYIWHTTGSGKTLTSFKAATLLKDNPDIEKCLFVVDRKDLDRQTRQEFNKFQEGCVEENTHTDSLVTRLISDDYANKVIVTTIQKLGLALDPNRKDPKRKINYRELLHPLSKKRVVFIFDECHRSQFGENHQAIKDFFPNAQLFGFTGTPIFEKNSKYIKINGEEATNKTTEDIFHKQLHAYTITHAIDDKNVLPFHIDYFKPDAKNAPKAGETLAQKAVVEAILDKHDAATAARRFNAVLATASINNAIEYYNLFKTSQQKRLAQDETFKPLNIACVFSPPTQALAKDEDQRNQKNVADVKQIEDDLTQEKFDNQQNPEEKKKALETIIAHYNQQFNTNHRIYEFDLYYQDVQERIKNHKYPNADYAHKNKIDLMIVVDMLLTGFDSKYLNTLYVDKNLKYHGLIQAFSRTNRILNGAKPYGNILDFRSQRDAVEEAMLTFSGESIERAREIWQVDPAPVVMEKYQTAVAALGLFMKEKGLPCKPAEVSNLRGDNARGTFVNHFKEVQRLKTQLDQYTNLTADDKDKMEELLPENDLRSFKSRYIDIARALKAKQDKGGDPNNPNNQLDFEFILFASELIDYDYIMGLVVKLSQRKPSKQKMTLDEIIGLIESDAKFIGQRDELVAYLKSLDLTHGVTEQDLKKGFDDFKNNTLSRELNDIAQKNGIEIPRLTEFVENVMTRRVFDGEKLTDLLEYLDLSWKQRRLKEVALMNDLLPLIKKRANGREISGLAAYE